MFVLRKLVLEVLLTRSTHLFNTFTDNLLNFVFHILQRVLIFAYGILFILLACTSMCKVTQFVTNLSVEVTTVNTNEQ